MSENLTLKHQKRKVDHPVKAIIDSASSDVLVVNELAVGNSPSQILEILKRYGYEYEATGCDPNPNGVFERNTMIILKRQAQN